MLASVLSLLRVIPGYFETLVNMIIHPIRATSALTAKSDMINAWAFFFMCILVTQLFRARYPSNMERIFAITAMDIGWKCLMLFILVILLYGLISIFNKVDISRITVFLLYTFGALSLIVHAILIVFASLPETGIVESTFGECIESWGPYGGAVFLDSPECRKLIEENHQLYEEAMQMDFNIDMQGIAASLTIFTVSAVYFFLFYVAFRRQFFVKTGWRYAMDAIILAVVPVLLAVGYSIRLAFIRI
jgi:hypothetical protein